MHEIAATTPDKINRLHDELTRLAVKSLDRAIQIGELLSETKASLPHGAWLNWLNENIAFSERTARNYIRLFEKREQIESANVTDLTTAYRVIRLYGEEPTAEEQAKFEQLEQLEWKIKLALGDIFSGLIALAEIRDKEQWKPKWSSFDEYLAKWPEPARMKKMLALWDSRELWDSRAATLLILAECAAAGATPALLELADQLRAIASRRESDH